MDAISLLERKLRKANVADRPGILQGAYKQMVVSVKGRAPRDGEYRASIKDDDERNEFGRYLFEQLKINGLESHANRLYDQVLLGKAGKEYIEKLKEAVQSHHGS